jgi:hypothetical protein
MVSYYSFGLFHLWQLKTGFTLAKIRQKTKGYSQTKFYRDASDLYKEACIAP